MESGECCQYYCCVVVMIRIIGVDVALAVVVVLLFPLRLTPFQLRPPSKRGCNLLTQTWKTNKFSTKKEKKKNNNNNM